MRRFLEEEAELGSDDEENDDNRKRINRDDEDEYDGDELDEDLDGFVVRGDEDDINNPTEDMYQRFREEEERRDKEDIARTVQAVLFGNNKKRKRGEVEGLEDEMLDEDAKKKKKILLERIRQRNLQDTEMFVNQAMEGGEINLDALRQQQLALQAKSRLMEEEELSEDEVKRQEVSDEYYRMQKTLLEKNNELKRFNSTIHKQTKEDEQIEAYIEDIPAMERNKI